MLSRALLLPLALAALAPTAAAAPYKTPTLGTPLTWHSEVAAAQLVASAEGKLVLALHLSGDFRDAATTCRAAQHVRTLLNDPQLDPLLERFVGAHQTTGTLVVLRRGSRILRQQGGSVALFVLTPKGRVVHAIAGAITLEDLIRELTWAVKHAADLDRLARAHLTAARALSRLRVLTPAASAPRPLGPRLADLGSRVPLRSTRHDPALSNARLRLTRALIHARLASAPSHDLAATSTFVWTRVLRQTYSNIPVRELQMRWRCRLPARLRIRCGARTLKEPRLRTWREWKMIRRRGTVR